MVVLVWGPVSTCERPALPGGHCPAAVARGGKDRAVLKPKAGAVEEEPVCSSTDGRFCAAFRAGKLSWCRGPGR